MIPPQGFKLLVKKKSLFDHHFQLVGAFKKLVKVLIEKWCLKKSFLITTFQHKPSDESSFCFVKKNERKTFCVLIESKNVGHPNFFVTTCNSH